LNFLCFASQVCYFIVVVPVVIVLDAVGTFIAPQENLPSFPGRLLHCGLVFTVPQHPRMFGLGKPFRVLLSAYYYRTNCTDRTRVVYISVLSRISSSTTHLKKEKPRHRACISILRDS